ncbi:P-loop NTPase [Nitrospira sp. Ecomares 2.1]
MPNPLPLALRRSLESGECVLFVGAGIGGHLQGEAGRFAPDATSLAKEIAEEFSIETTNYILPKITQVVTIRKKGKSELVAFLQRRLEGLDPDSKLRWLFTLRWKAIFTTNYDNGIQRAYDLNPSPSQTPVTIAISSEIVDFDPRFQVPIYHLHGNLFGESNPSIVITEDDYVRYREKRRMMFNVLQKEFATSTALYIGYSNQDSNWKVVFEELKTDIFPTQLPPAYRIAPGTDQLDKEILESQGIETLDLSLEDFVEAASSELTEINVSWDRINRIRERIPTDLIDSFERFPAATTRLLTCWSYVNQENFDEVPNIKSFLFGDRPNWALIAKRIQFERDIEEQVYNGLLDYATGSNNIPKIILTLGPAGYGISTLLMSLAVELVKDHAGPVFMHKPNTAIREGDLEFAASIFPQRPFFIIDNPAEHNSTLGSITQRLRDAGKTACFLLGERLNEWRQTRARLAGDEYVLDPLSDPEIFRLIKVLEENNSLGLLKDLDDNFRHAAIKQKHNKELLVAMRETTEGKAFDAILEDEYRNIADAPSKDLYLIVSCFHQHGALARDTLLADLLKLPIDEMYRKTRDSTEGVIIYECLDESYGHYAARTRHRLIAEIVWQRCGNLGEREKIILSGITSLNLTYRIDRESFDNFIKSDRLVDCIRTLEGKTQFFDSAIKKDPDNPYVRQHYARMLLRQNRSELALGQIEQGLQIAPRERILHHTKGVILYEMAMSNISIEIARKRLVQSEGEFRRCLAMNNRDEYSWQSLAELFLSWAKKAPTLEEATDYIRKTEEVIEEGLRSVRSREGLWVTSSKVQQWVKDEPSRIEFLEKAVSENPGSIIAPYLLGRAYRQNGAIKKALDVLKTVVKANATEFRSCVEYSRALIEYGEPYSKAIAILQLSTLYGYSDPRFIATLGGMLFMNGDFTAAAKVFEETTKQQFPGPEQKTIQFRPPDPKNKNLSCRFAGEVLSVKSGYAFIQCYGYPEFFCPGSNFSGIILRPGLELTFEPGFCARGPVADKLALP